MYIYYDRNKVLREIINDDAIVEGLNRNKIFVYYELQGDNVLTDCTAQFVKPDDTVVDAVSSEINKIAKVDNEWPDNAYIPFNQDRDLKFFKYGKGYPFTAITVNQNVYTISGAVLGVITATVGGYSAETLERFSFMVESTGIRPEEVINYSEFEYLLQLFANKNVFAVNSLPVDVSIYQADDLVIDLTTKKLYRITGDPRVANEWVDLADIVSDISTLQSALTTHINDLSNPHQVTKAQVGLGNVDNTSDLNKPISNATQAALDNKVDKTTNGYKIYGTDELGNQVLLPYDEDTEGKVVRRDESGHIYVQNPNANGQATPKQYVDNLVAPKADKTYVDDGLALKANQATTYTKTEVDNAIASAVSSAYIYKGTKTVAEINALDTSDLVVGWVYNVSDSGTITLGSLSVNAGDNIAWTGNEWDILAGVVDLSDYYTKTQTNTLLGGKQDTIDSSHKLSADLVDDTSTTNKFVSASDITNWNGKADKTYVDNNFVLQTRTIAGIDLSANISAQNLTNNLVFATNTDVDNLL